MSNIYGKLRRDDDCHWYLVPESQLEAFDAAMEKIEGEEYLDAADDFDAFELEFGEFRIDGVEDLKVLIQ